MNRHLISPSNALNTAISGARQGAGGVAAEAVIENHYPAANIHFMAGVFTVLEQSESSRYARRGRESVHVQIPGAGMFRVPRT